MDIFDSSHFSLNKKRLVVIGLWHYDPQRKAVQLLWLVSILLSLAPHVNIHPTHSFALVILFVITSRIFLIYITAVIVHISDIDKLLEHLCISLIIFQTFLKYITLVVADNKIKFVFDDIRKNWLSITDAEEKRILVTHSKRGRIFTVAYMYMLVITAVTFLVIPIVPELLNAIDPLPVPRSHLYVLNGEFLLENRDDHFFKIYLWDSASIICVVVLDMSLDPMYMVIMEQGIGLYAIITHSLPKLRQKTVSDSQDETNSSYEWLLRTIKLHQSVLSNIEDSYSLCFFCLTIINIIHISVDCFVVMVHWHDAVNLTRYGLVLISLLIHVFVLFWLGQRLIDHSTILLGDAYCNDWYETPEMTKKVLRIFMLRCSKPCIMTAGGLVEMNFEVYLKIVKTAASYITVLASYR